MSSAAWTDYGVPGSPYFVFVHGPSGRVRGEGTGPDWDQVSSLLEQATGEVAHADQLAANRVRKPSSDADRESRIDAELLAAGVPPGDPSLYTPPDAGRGRSPPARPRSRPRPTTPDTMSDTTPPPEPETTTSTDPADGDEFVEPTTSTSAAPDDHDAADHAAADHDVDAEHHGGAADDRRRLRHRGRRCRRAGRGASASGASRRWPAARVAEVPGAEGVGPEGTPSERPQPIAHLANFPTPSCSPPGSHPVIPASTRHPRSVEDEAHQHDHDHLHDHDPRPRTP